jgi:hypothetical protein
MSLADSWLLSGFVSADGVEVLRWDCGYGRRIQEPGPLFAKILKAGREIDLDFNTWNTMVVSAKARGILEEWAPAAIQYIPVSISDSSQPYFVANVIQLVDCLDETLSLVRRFEPNNPVRPDRAGEIWSVMDLRIEASRADGCHIFRIAKYDQAMIVSEKLKGALESAGTTGFIYVDVTSPSIAEFRVRHAERERNCDNAKDLKG